MRAVIHWILDVLFPKKCVNCSREGAWLCDSCEELLEGNDELYCYRCKRPNEWGRICPDCSSQSYLDAVIVYGKFGDEIIQALIHTLKFDYVEEIGGIIGNAMATYFNDKGFGREWGTKSFMMIPVPLSRKKLLSRDFNQSERIGKMISQLCDIPMSTEIIRRERDTKSQSQLSREDRLVNVQEAFSVINAPIPKNIILVDDVITTGATMEECARELRKAGAEHIVGFVFAQNVP